MLLDADLHVVALAAVDERDIPKGWLAAMVAAWAAFIGLALGAVWTTAARRYSGVGN